MRLSLLALLAAATAAYAADSTRQEYTLYHRVLSAGAAPEFEHRGTVSLDGFSAALDQSKLKPVSADEGQWYQVALGVGDELLTASTRAVCGVAECLCIPVLQLADATTQCFASDDAFLTLHLTDGRPTSIEYKGARTPASGACPLTPEAHGSGLVNVRVEGAQKVFGPALVAPAAPKLDATGQPEPPVEEKTFLQKYWFGIVCALLFIATNLGEEPKKDGQGQGQPAARA
ncbi:uncharacterized protein LOC62_07G008931 [Vanrija pseudolonga]|uniref:ER membrane protein complex subunit 10 n=1 Tax=Vanrija pseudolonga TaxID=143232 RepID=A0AAF0YFK0_9TREE|nr:hypothetical protein LOC62_07G008931 [Vanrija pseudolonga]